MKNNPIAPLPRKKKKKKTSPLPSFSSIPDDVIVNVFARLSKSHYSSLCLVSKNFYSLLSSPDIYFARSLVGNTDCARLYVRLWLPNPSSISHHHHSWFNLGYRQGRLSLVPVKALSSSGSPDRLNSATVAVGSEIYEIGGSNEEQRTRAVRVLDCRSHTWRRAPDMKVARKHAKSYLLDDKIYVIRGCTRTEVTMTWGEVFDLKTQTWKTLPKPPPSGDDVNSVYHGVVFGGRLYGFTVNNKNYAYDPKEERWVREAGFVGLGRISGPWCVIGNVIFAEHGRMLKWCDPRNGKWSVVHGLSLIPVFTKHYRRTQLVNHGGKLVIIWEEWNGDQRDRSVWCAVISFEKRLTPSSTMWGKVEEFNVVLDSVPKSFKLSSCLSLLV
ncbi:putative F-box/kelch-repeat protein [Raphanus sativus]|uniref:F-box/kelch-repeat protein At4g35120 n=1 Tax=Raphanus sativus TaxID=3726 RepID=A0A6J0MC06_RAPSA|nr:putative F-box/kelch-repeat protein At4g35120 [Raphanus sativus]KAJ4913939.1 putative F-box/kelch-repeat protein [Raphanus sativus]